MGSLNSKSVDYTDDGWLCFFLKFLVAFLVITVMVLQEILMMPVLRLAGVQGQLKMSLIHPRWTSSKAGIRWQTCCLDR